MKNIQKQAIFRMNDDRLVPNPGQSRDIFAVGDVIGQNGNY